MFLKLLLEVDDATEGEIAGSTTCIFPIACSWFVELTRIFCGGNCWNTCGDDDSANEEDEDEIEENDPFPSAEPNINSSVPSKAIEILILLDSFKNVYKKKYYNKAIKNNI